jgi:hypothetical protein
MEKYLYNVLNIFVLVIASSYVFYMVNEIDANYVNASSDTVPYVLLVLSLIIVSQGLKFFRVYLLIMEKRVPFKRFLKVYLKTMFVSLTVPFKLGEFFRIFCYGHEMKSNIRGLLTVVLDRFFDTIALLSIVCFIELCYLQTFSFLSIGLTLFLGIMMIIYYSFPNLYQYFNTYLVLSVNSIKGLLLLEYLERSLRLYENIVSLIRERVVLIIII